MEEAETFEVGDSVALTPLAAIALDPETLQWASTELTVTSAGSRLVRVKNSYSGYRLFHADHLRKVSGVQVFNRWVRESKTSL